MLNNTRPYFIHIRPHDVDTNPKGGVTVAIEGDEDKGYAFAVAQCHSKDNYNKRVGRAKAAGRLLSQDYRTDLPDDICTIREAEAHVRALYNV